MLIISHAVLAPNPQCCIINGEEVNTNIIVFGLNPMELESTIYHTPGVLQLRERNSRVKGTEVNCVNAIAGGEGPISYVL
jgi:hypothetical protein